MRTKPRTFTPRKLLVAVAGVASVNYMLACERSQPPTSGNLMAPVRPLDVETPPTSGNLPAPIPLEVPVATDAGAPVVADAGSPSPADAGAAKDAGATKGGNTKPVSPVAPRRPPTAGNLRSD